MKERDLDPIAKELARIVTKYHLNNCAFCGTTEDGEFWGCAVGEKVFNKDIFNIAMNVGRLWQHFRGETRRILNTFEKEIWK